MPTEKESSSDSDDPIDANEFTSEETFYSTPAQRSVKEIIEADCNDKSLRKYKEQLLGANPSGSVLVEPDNPKNVILKRISLVSGDQIKHSINLPAIGDVIFSIKEGCSYRIRFEFVVQREIVAGLKYAHKLSRLGVGVNKEVYMLGSYGPRPEPYTYETPSEEAPSGMLSRGKYRVHSLITDDDKHNWLDWSWYIEIAKSW
uniref:Rho GDP-dissociation inhibitor 1-like n=1 Tax=Globodera pallida TaxID=36090 RepID=A0A183BKQ1_GLOPA